MFSDFQADLSIEEVGTCVHLYFREIKNNVEAFYSYRLQENNQKVAIWFAFTKLMSGIYYLNGIN